MRRSLFTARTRETKEKHRKRDAALRKEIGELLKKDGWLPGTANLLAAWDPYDQNAHAEFFDPEWMFGMTDGFDVVIGNPPYGADIPAEQLNAIFAKAKDTNNKNSAAVFVDKAKNDLIEQNGIVAFIVPKSLLYSEIWLTLVNALLPHTLSLVDVEQAFDNVLLEQVVFIYSQPSDGANYIGRKFVNSVFTTDTQIPKEAIGRFQAWICGVSAQELKIGMKLLDCGIFMRDVSISTRGLSMQANLSSSGGYQIIGGKNIHRYGLNGIKGYIKRGDVDKAKKKLSSLMQPKVMSQQIVAHIQNPTPHIKIIATVDSEGSVLGLDTVENTFIKENANLNLNFVAALFNSNLINWYTYKFIFCSAIRTMHFDEYYIGKIPIPEVGADNQEQIVAYVDRILAAKRADPSADTTSLEREIDQLVYQLYGLTGDEIAIVEGKR